MNDVIDIHCDTALSIGESLRTADSHLWILWSLIVSLLSGECCVTNPSCS